MNPTSTKAEGSGVSAGAAASGDRTVRPAEKKPRGLGRRLARIGLGLPATYAAYVVIGLVAQRQLVFPGATAWGRLPANAFDRRHVPIDGRGGEGGGWFLAAMSAVNAGEGSVTGARVDPRGSSEGDGGVVGGRSGNGRSPLAVIFHGNMERASDVISIGERYHARGFAVLYVEYPGYAGEAGEPSEESIVRSAASVLDTVLGRGDIDPARVVFHGRSLGGGVACAVARERTPAGLVLQSTFVSMRAMFARYLYPPGLCRDRFESGEVVRTLACPVLLIHGTRDTIVPVWHSRRLLEAAGDRGVLVETGGGHNDVPRGEEDGAYEAALDAFVERAGLRRGG